MIPPGRQRDDLQLRVGLKLYDMGMQGSSEDWILFSAADHPNATSLQLETHDPTFLIKLNLQVAERALLVAAYQHALKYLGMARQSLSRMKTPWEKYYDITFRVYQATVDVELCLGHFEVGMAVGQTLIGRAKSLEDKLPAYLAICRAFGRREQHKEAYDLSVNILRIMGAIRKGSIGVKIRLFKDFLYVKRFFASHSDADILAVPLLKDKRLETIMELLSEAGTHAYFCSADLDFLSAVSRMLVISLTKGLSPICSTAMTGYSLFCNALDDMKGTNRFSNLASEILDLTKAKEPACLQLFSVTLHVYAWKDPPEQIIDLYERAHKLGMESGDFENGMLSQVAGYHHAFVTGHPLADLELNYLSVMKRLRLYNMKFVHAFAEEEICPIQYLRGTAEIGFDPIVLSKYGPTGIAGNASEKFQLISGFIGRLQLAVYFNEDDLALQSMQGLDRVSDTDTSFASASVRLCFSSLAYATLYRNRRRRSYLNKSKRCLQELKRLCRIKGTICWHR